MHPLTHSNLHLTCYHMSSHPQTLQKQPSTCKLTQTSNPHVTLPTTISTASSNLQHTLAEQRQAATDGTRTTSHCDPSKSKQPDIICDGVRRSGRRKEILDTLFSHSVQSQHAIKATRRQNDKPTNQRIQSSSNAPTRSSHDNTSATSSGDSLNSPA